MPHIRTDDGPRRLRAVWLGPRGYRWYWTWTYVQWSATVVATAVAVAGVFAVVWGLSGELKIALIIGPLWGGALGVLGTRKAMKHVDYDRPVRYWRVTLRNEWAGSRRAPRPDAAPEGWWLSPAEPRLMSRYALAYMGLSTTKRPPKRPRVRFTGPITIEPVNARHEWPIFDQYTGAWPQLVAAGRRREEDR